jgi:putative nucleotidyltransferase with HDIG domain
MPRPLPENARRLLVELNVPPTLLAHLTIVHDVSCDLLQALDRHFPSLEIDREAIRYGAATHDVGKISYPEELGGPGHQHEQVGTELLERHGVPTDLARFARTHGIWDRSDMPLEDLLVALSDELWKGGRNDGLENLVVEKMAEMLGKEKWLVFCVVDRTCSEIAAHGLDRLSLQRAASTDVVG